MSEGSPEGQGTEALQGQEQEFNSEGQQVQEPEGTGINPAWNDLLSVVPSQLHSQVVPHLSKWDKNYQSGLQKVHSQYEAYKPFVEQEVPADRLKYGYELVQALEEKPAEVIDALVAFAQEQNIPLSTLAKEIDEAEQGTNSEQGFEGNDLSQHPQFVQLQQAYEQLQSQVEQSSREKAEQAEIEKINQELIDLRAEHGDFDEEWVLTKAANDPKGDLVAAVEAYKEFENRVRESARPGPPKVLGPGGSSPNTGLDVTKLDSKGRKSVVQQMLQQAQAQGD